MRPWLLRRQGITRATIAAGLALVAGTIVAISISQANDLADTYGARRTVVVAARDLTVGRSIEDADLRRVNLPIALVIGTPVAAPTGRTVVAPVLAGEPIVAERLAPDGISGPMALAPDDSRAVAIPTPSGRPPVTPGDRVDIVAVALDGTTRAPRVATGAVVLATSDDTVTVAVEPAELTATARAALEGTAVLALTRDR
jgi:Flp pilus assembly protein CpaB